jgi:hypothetical protein
MRRKYFLLAGIIVIAIALWIFHLFTQRRPSLDDMKADISIESVDLYNQYQQNEATANTKYLDKIIEVKGTVTDIQQTDSTLGIELNGADAGGINCGMADNMHGKELLFKKGDTLTVKGKCSGFLMDVNLVDCIIEK